MIRCRQRDTLLPRTPSRPQLPVIFCTFSIQHSVFFQILFHFLSNDLEFSKDTRMNKLTLIIRYVVVKGILFVIILQVGLSQNLKE